MAKKKAARPAAQKKPAAPKSKAGHPKGGRPAPGERKIVPDDYPVMARMYGRGLSYQQIAEKFGVHANTISNHFANHIFPSVKASPARSLEAELLKIDTLAEVAWEQFASEVPAETREQIRTELGRIKPRDKTKAKQLDKLLEKTLTTVHRQHDRGWLDLVKWCIDIRCRLAGHFAAVKHRVQIEEYRVAGQSPAEGMESMLLRIVTKVQERREYEERLQSAGVTLSRLSATRN